MRNPYTPSRPSTSMYTQVAQNQASKNALDNS